MKNLKKTQGAVSIFLVIILVPMMTVSALFVDAGKVRLARGVQEAAGDLALNTALTEYDTQLKDLYGLFATAQDTTELFDMLEDYYRTSIMSSGVGVEEADNIVDSLMAQLGLVSESNDVADILKMQLVDFDVSKRADASLANSTILEKQIVEFMKYRSPINTGLGFLSSLKSFVTLSKQTELVEKRTEYYEEQNEVLESLKKAWDNINEYNKLDLIKDEQYFKKIQDALDGKYQEEYKELNRKTIMDLYDTQNYADYQCGITSDNPAKLNHPTDGNPISVYVWKMTLVINGSAASYNDYTKLSQFNKNTLPSVSNFQSLINAYYSSKNKMEASKASLTNFSSPSDVYDLQYLVQAGRSHELREYTYKVGDYYQAFQALKHAEWWLQGYEGDQQEEIRNTTISSNGNSRTIDQFCADIESDFNSTMANEQKLTRVFTDISRYVMDNGLTKTDSVNSKVSEIGNKMGNYRDTLKKAADYLDDARKAIEKAKKSVDGGKLETARENWQSAASDREIEHTSMAKQDLAELDELDTYLNPTDMEKMITRLKNVADNLRKTVELMESYRFDGVFIGDIRSYDDLKNTIEKTVGASELKNVPLGKSALESFAANAFHWEQKKVDLSWINDSGTQIKLHGQGTDKLNFYSYLYTHFNDNSGTVSAKTETTKKEDKSKGKKRFEEIKKNKKSATEKEAGESSSKSDKEIRDCEGIPTKEAGASGETKGAGKVEAGDDAVKNTSSNLGGMFNDLGKTLKQLGTKTRDHLFISDYILSMLSYDTLEKETEKRSGEDASPKTLTREPISADNNYAYLCEVEYILYGGKNSGNITKAYASIYAIRLGFNLIYAFTSSEIRETAFAIATPISAATLGVVPVPLIQAAIIAAVSCCESGVDISELREGNEVPLFKDKQTWRMSISGMTDYAMGKATEIVKDTASSAITESQKVLIELLDKTDKELTEDIEASQERLETALNGAYDTLIMRQANTAIQKMTTLVNQTIDEAALKGIDNVPEYVKKELEQWGNEGDPNDLGTIAKREAVKKLTSGSLIDDFTESMKKAANGQLENAENELNSILDAARVEVTDYVQESSQEIINQKNKLKEKATSAINDGADSLRNTINEQLDGIFGETSSSVEGAADNTGLASLLSFRYSDYLRLFLLIGMITNENAVIMRLADAIQVNMEKMKNHPGYRLKNSATYVNLESTVQVPPTFLALPLFSKVEGNPAGDSRWYTLDYSDIRGY